MAAPDEYADAYEDSYGAVGEYSDLYDDSYGATDVPAGGITATATVTALPAVVANSTTTTAVVTAVAPATATATATVTALPSTGGGGGGTITLQAGLYHFVSGTWKPGTLQRRSGGAWRIIQSAPTAVVTPTATTDLFGSSFTDAF